MGWLTRIADGARTLRVARALRHRNYQLYFAGQGTSLIGTWLTRFAIAYETYALSHSPFQLGLVAFCSQAPTALLAPFAGVLVDRWDRHRTLVVTQICAMLQSAALAVFALTGLMTVWYLMALGAVQAVINAVDVPARQSFVRQTIDDRGDLPIAIALNSSLVNGARLVGPVVAALLVGWVGIGGCFTVDAASYLAVIAALLAMRISPQPRRASRGRVLTELRDGFAYVRGIPLVRGVLLLLAATSVLAGAYAALLPAVAEGTLHGDAHTLGWLMGAAGLGALIGVLFLTRFEGAARLSTVIANCALAVGVALIALEGAPTVPLAMAALFALGFFLMMQWAATNTVVQTLVDDDKLGRVMSLYAVVFFAGAPVGALLEGTLANVLGPIHTFAIAGALCLYFALGFRRALPSLRARTVLPAA